MKEKEIINQEIKKTFDETERIITALLNETDKINSPARKDIETRWAHWIDNSEPPFNDEKKLRYDFNAVKDMLIKVVDNLPDLLNEEGKINQEFLTFITDFLAGSEKLESGKEEKVIIIPVNKNSVHWLISSSEKKRLENELAQERSKSFQLKKKLDSLEADEKKQLKQWEEVGHQMGIKVGKMKNELESTDFSKLSEGELDNYLNEFWEINRTKSLIEILLSNNTKEKIKIIGDDEYEKLKKISDQLELERELRDARQSAKQVIADVLVDKFAAEKGKKAVVIDKGELLKEEYRNYSETLDEKNNSEDIITFERRILQSIAKQRNEYQAIDEGLSLGKKAIESKNPKRIKEAYEYLSNFRELQLEKKEKFNDYNILLEKRGEFYALRFKLLNLIETVAQVEQPAK